MIEILLCVSVVRLFFCSFLQSFSRYSCWWRYSNSVLSAWAWHGMVDRAFVRCCSCVRTLSRCVLKFLFCSDSPPDVCLLNCYCVKPRTYHKASPSSEKATSPIGERHNGRRCDAMWFHSILLIGVMCVVLVFDMVSTVDDVYVFQPNKRAHYQFLLALTIWIFNIQSIIY